MKLKELKYGYYQNYHSGDGSMYDHCTAYTRTQKKYTIFSEDDIAYYDLLDETAAYNKNAEYGETSVTIESDLLDLLPHCIDDSKDYNVDEIISILPRKLASQLYQQSYFTKTKVL